HPVVLTSGVSLCWLCYGFLFFFSWSPLISAPPRGRRRRLHIVIVTRPRVIISLWLASSVESMNFSSSRQASSRQASSRQAVRRLERRSAPIFSMVAGGKRPLVAGLSEFAG